MLEGEKVDPRGMESPAFLLSEIGGIGVERRSKNPLDREKLPVREARAALYLQDAIDQRILEEDEKQAIMAAVQENVDTFQDPYVQRLLRRAVGLSDPHEEPSPQTKTIERVQGPVWLEREIQDIVNHWRLADPQQRNEQVLRYREEKAAVYFRDMLDRGVLNDDQKRALSELAPRVSATFNSEIAIRQISKVLE